MVTRHLVEYMPEHFKGQFRPVAAFAPGVLGITGIETSQIIKGVSAQGGPRRHHRDRRSGLRKLGRLATTFSCATRGFRPDRGWATPRTQIDRETLGVPVIAIGVPTVVDAATLTCDVMDSVMEKNHRQGAPDHAGKLRGRV